VENFKGIREMKLEGLGMVNVFVGGNNVGKTSVLQAIHLFEWLDLNDEDLTTVINKNPRLPLSLAEIKENLFSTLAMKSWSYDKRTPKDFVYRGDECTGFNTGRIQVTSDAGKIGQAA
jgi:AAA15 family ATPase/GTPase